MNEKDRMGRIGSRPHWAYRLSNPIRAAHLVGAAHHGFLPGPATILLAFVIASIGSHAPKTVRHRLLF